MGAPGWPVTMADGPVGLRPLRLRDAPAWLELRQRNAAWLRPWESTPPEGGYFREGFAAFWAMHRELRGQARDGRAYPFAVTLDRGLVGQLTVGNVVRGSLNCAYAGYWVDERIAGQGVMPTALALAVDHLFGPARLHRLEANIRPDNAASRRVVEKLGFREEGLRRRYLHIDGAYRDHLCYALTVEDVPEGLLRRWHAARAAAREGRDGSGR